MVREDEGFDEETLQKRKSFGKQRKLRIEAGTAVWVVVSRTPTGFSGF
jgi:hypothetical protein